MKGQTKVVVRRLPPDLAQYQFEEAVEPFLKDVDWKYFHKGKVRATKEATRCGVAYLNFKNPQQSLEFSYKFNGTKLKSAKGVVFTDLSVFSNYFYSLFKYDIFFVEEEYVCMVEYAPYPRIPRQDRPKDPRKGKYEQGELTLSAHRGTYVSHYFPRLIIC
jgi:hypothetical protein